MKTLQTIEDSVLQLEGFASIGVHLTFSLLHKSVLSSLMSTTEPSADKLCRYHSSNTPARRAHDLVRIADTHQWGTEITTEVKTDKQHVQ